MKRLLSLLAIAACSAAHGAAFDIRVPQRNAADDNDDSRYLSFPGAGINGVFLFDGTAVLPKVATLGSGFSFNSGTGVLTATGTSTGTVSSVTAGTGLSGGVITTTGTISMPNTDTPGTYTASVTTDAQGRVTSGASRSINDSPGRSLVTATTATGFQISSTRDARVCYEGKLTTTSTIGGPSSASVFLETANTNSTTPADWTTIATLVADNNVTLAVALQVVDGEPWSICRTVAAAKFVRIRSAGTGTFAVTLNTQQQEETL